MIRTPASAGLAPDRDRPLFPRRASVTSIIFPGQRAPNHRPLVRAILPLGKTMSVRTLTVSIIIMTTRSAPGLTPQLRRKTRLAVPKLSPMVTKNSSVTIVPLRRIRQCPSVLSIKHTACRLRTVKSTVENMTNGLWSMVTMVGMELKVNSMLDILTIIRYRNNGAVNRLFPVVRDTFRPLGPSSLFLSAPWCMKNERLRSPGYIGNSPPVKWQVTRAEQLLLLLLLLLFPSTTIVAYVMTRVKIILIYGLSVSKLALTVMKTRWNMTVLTTF